MVSIILLLFGFVLFVLTGLGLPQPPRMNFLGWGLAACVLAEILLRTGLLLPPVK